MPEPGQPRGLPEGRNPSTVNIDQLDAGPLLRAIHEEDATVPAALAASLPELERLVVAAVDALRAGGRVHYVGAGTSGRIGCLDAAEIFPTYGVDGAIVAHIAGGAPALTAAVEGAEDDEEAGHRELSAVAASDVVVGLAASGSTPYVRGALRAARAQGAIPALITSNPAAALASQADITVVLETGSEVVMGSTRMKAGTALKVTLNAFSTAVMVLLGRTYSNLMVGIEPTNAKLAGRRMRILREATGCTEEAGAAALQAAGGELPTAIVMLLADRSVEEARAALAVTGGSVRAAVASMTAAEAGE